MQIVNLSLRTTAAKRQDFNRLAKRLDLTQAELFTHMMRCYQEQIKIK